MKRYLKYLSYLVVPILMLLLINYDRVVPFIEKMNRGDGVVLELFNFVGRFFKFADTWSLIFVAIFFIALLIGFIYVDIITGKLLEKVKPSTLQFVKKDWFKLSIQKLVVGFFLLLVFISVTNGIIHYVGNRNTVTVQEAEKAPVIVLGTNKYLSSAPDAENLYFTYRINKAVELYKKGKVEYFIVSGDRTESENYDETLMMQKDLMAAGVPKHLIKRDTAGYRTLDSMLRLRGKFGLSKVYIVSQAFHTKRAIFQAWFYSMDAKAINAEGTATMAMLKRELLAKPNVFLDLFLFNMQPRSGALEFREDFAVNSEASAWLVILISIAIIAVLWSFFREMENRTKGINKGLTIAGCSTVGAILLIIAVYKNTEIEAVEFLVEKTAETTGAFSSAVETKKEQKQAITSVLKKVKVKQAAVKTEIQKMDSLQAVITQLQLQQKAREDSILNAQLAINNQEEPVTKEVFKSIKTTEKKPEIREEIKEKEEQPVNNAFASISSSNKKNDPFRSASSERKRQNIKVLIHRSQQVNHDQEIQLRLADPIQVGGNRFEKGFVFSGRIVIENKEVKVFFNLAGKEGYIINERSEPKLSSRLYQSTPKGYLISTGGVQTAKI